MNLPQQTAYDILLLLLSYHTKKYMCRSISYITQTKTKSPDLGFCPPLIVGDTVPGTVRCIADYLLNTVHIQYRVLHSLAFFLRRLETKQTVLKCIKKGPLRPPWIPSKTLHSLRECDGPLLSHRRLRLHPGTLPRSLGRGGRGEQHNEHNAERLLRARDRSVPLRMRRRIPPRFGQ